jgi:hypothetical protein
MVSPYAAGPAKVKVGDPLLREGKTGTLEHRLHTRVRDDCCMYCHACVCCAAPPSPCLPSTLTIHSTPPLRRAVTQRCRCSRGLESVQQSAGGRLVEPFACPRSPRFPASQSFDAGEGQQRPDRGSGICEEAGQHPPRTRARAVARHARCSSLFRQGTKKRTAPLPLPLPCRSMV